MSDRDRVSDLRARVLRAAAERPSPTRGALVARRAIAGALAFAWLAIVVALGRARPEAAGMLVFAAWTMGAVAISAFALAAPKTSLGRPRLALSLLGPLIGVLVVLAAWSGGLLLGHSDDHHAGEGTCWLLSVGVAIVPLALALWVERASDPIAPGASGAAIGAAAGAWGAVAMGFVCGRSEPLHVLVGHVLSFFAIVVLAAVIGRRVLMLR
jgi:hypothetical protein